MPIPPTIENYFSDGGRAVSATAKKLIKANKNKRFIIITIMITNFFMRLSFFSSILERITVIVYEKIIKRRINNSEEFAKYDMYPQGCSTKTI